MMVFKFKLILTGDVMNDVTQNNVPHPNDKSEHLKSRLTSLVFKSENSTSRRVFDHLKSKLIWIQIPTIKTKCVYKISSSNQIGTRDNLNLPSGFDKTLTSGFTKDNTF